MGQKFGIPSIDPGIKAFTNLPREALESLWRSYTLNGEGWGLDITELGTIFSGSEYLTKTIGFSDTDLANLFNCFDSDNNELVDALEIFMTLALISGMDIIDKIQFAFSAYDFDQAHALGKDEISLLLRSAAKGLSKVTNTAEPTIEQIDQITDIIFSSNNKSNAESLTISEFQTYNTLHPVISSWIQYYSAAPAKRLTAHDLDDSDIEDFDISELPSVNILRSSSSTNQARSWFKEADKLLPEDLPPTRSDPAEDILTPFWVHGYRSTDKRNNVYYGATGNIVYFTANMSISLERGDEETGGGWIQKMVLHHEHPISCIDVDAFSRSICVTADKIDTNINATTHESGQQKSTKIVLWDTTTHSVINAIKLPSSIGIKAVSLSTDGKYLLALSSDEDCTVYIYQTSKMSQVFTTKLGSQYIMDAKFAGTTSMFAVVGSNILDFYIEEGGSFMGEGKLRVYEKRPAMFHAVGKEAEGILMTCLSRFENEDELVTGNSKGHVMLWRGRNCQQLLKPHSKGVTSLSYCISKKLIASGGKDGKITLMKLSSTILAFVPKYEQHRLAVATTAGLDNLRLQTLETRRQLEVIAVLDLQTTDVIVHHVRSLCLSTDGSKILVGAKSGEILELNCLATPPKTEGEENEDGSSDVIKLGDDINKGSLIKGHWGMKLPKSKFNPDQFPVWGLCKTATGFASCGGDGTVRLWQAGEGQPQKVLKEVVLDSGCRCVGASGTEIAVGLDGTMNEARKGAVHIFNVNDLSFVAELPTTDLVPTDIKYSPDSSNLAVCSAEDGKIFLYSGGDGDWRLKAQLGLNRGYVCSVDFSNDSRYLRSWDRFDGLYTWDISGSTCSVEADMDTLKSIRWATNTVPCTWDTKGVWSGIAKGGDAIICSDRSNHLLVAGRASGVVALHKLPAMEYNPIQSSAVFLRAHIGVVSSVCFINDGNNLVTAGAEDGNIIVWKIAYDGDEREPDIIEEETNEEEPEEEEEEDEDAPPKVVFLDSADNEDLLDVDNGLLSHLPTSKTDDTTTPLSAVANWIGGIGLAKSDVTTTLPGLPTNDDLHLDWVYGYSSRLTRGAVRYSNAGKILYPAASMAVILTKSKRLQQYAMNHSDDITCLEVHPTRNLAVTGHRGKGNIIACVWDAATGKAIRHLNCGAVNAISAAAFSPDGVHLALACQDADHTILLFDWENADTLKASVAGGPKKVLTLVFSQSPTIRILQGGVGHFQILELVGRQLFTKTGQYGADSKKFNVLCAGALPLSGDGGSEFVVGLTNGTLGVISKGEKKISNYIPVQAKAITSLWVVIVPPATEGGEEPTTYKVVTGGIDGLIKVLDADFQPLSEYNLYHPKKNYGLHKLGALRGIKSICTDEFTRKILYGTSGGEIGEINFDDGLDVNSGPLVQGHCRDKCFGLATHPIRQECITVGDDRTLRVWSLEKKTQISLLDLPDIARVVSYSPTGQIVAVGLGGVVRGAGRVPRANDGKIVIISFLQGVLRIVFETQDARGPISTIVFTPDGSKLLVGSLYGKIYVYDVLDNFTLLSTLDRHASGVMSIDISTNGKLMASVDAMSDILLWDLDDLGTLVSEKTKPEIFKTELWHVRRNTTSYDSVGVFPAVGGAASDVLCLSRTFDKRLLCTGDVFGNLKLFRYPTQRPGSSFKLFRGHSPGGVANISFSVKDQFLLSLGREDKVMFQWRLEKVDDALYKPVDRQPVIPAPLVSLADCPLPALRDQIIGVHSVSLVINTVNFAKDAASHPTTPPDIDVHLNAILGMTASSCTSSQRTSLPLAVYSGSGDIFSVAGKIPFTLSKDRISQRAFTTTIHSKDIGTFALSSDARLICIAEKPPIDPSSDASIFEANLHIYLAASGIHLYQLPNSITGGVIAVSFSHDNLSLGCLSSDKLSTLTVFASASGSWTDAVRILVTPTDARTASLLSFILPSPTPEVTAFTLATGGEAVLRFWKISGYNYTTTAAEYKDKVSQPATISCMLSMKANQLVTGDVLGSLKLWSSNKCTTDIKAAHESAVSAINKCHLNTADKATSTGFITASSDKIQIWSDSCQPLSTYSLATYFQTLDRPFSKSTYVTGLSTDGKFRRLLVTTNTSLVFEVAMDSQIPFLINEGHMSGKFHAIAAHPTDSNYLISGGQDGELKVWNVTTKRTVEIHYLTNPISTISFRADGTSVAVATLAGGDAGGSVTILSFSSTTTPFLSTVQKLLNVGQGVIHMLRYSPDESFLAVASEDRSIYLYDVRHSYKLRGSVRSHSNAVLGLDFTLSGKFLRSFSKSRDNISIETRFFELHDQQNPPALELMDPSQLQQLVKERWFTVACPAAPEARGVLPQQGSGGGSDLAVGVLSTSGPIAVSSVTVDPKGKLIAAGIADGAVKIFRNPACANNSSGSHTYHGHATGPVSVVFTADGSHLCSAGAFDGTIMIWKIAEKQHS